MRVHAFASSAVLALALMSGACAAGPMSAPATLQEEGGPQVTVTRDGERLVIETAPAASRSGPGVSSTLGSSTATTTIATR